MAVDASCFSFLPVGLFMLYSIVFFVLIDCGHRTRALLSPLLLPPAGLSFWTIVHLDWLPGLASLWGLGLVVHVCHTTSLLYIERIKLDRDSCLASHRSYSPSRLLDKYRLWEDPQRLYAQRQAWCTRHRANLHSAAVFVVRRSAILLGLWAWHIYFVTKVFPAWFEPLRLDDFAEGRQVILRRLLPGAFAEPVTARELLLRLAFTLFWVWTSYAMLTGANIILSIMFVTLRLDDPMDWPWIFGSPLETYSMQKFWGKFWHRVAVPAYASHTTFVSRNVFRTKPGTRIEKAFVAYGIFGLSGLSHALCSWRLGDEQYAGDLWFFLANAGVVTAEVLLVHVSRAQRSVHLKTQPRWRRVSWRVAGHISVLMVLMWLVPKWQYPKLHDLLEQSFVLD